MVDDAQIFNIITDADISGTTKATSFEFSVQIDCKQ